MVTFALLLCAAAWAGPVDFGRQDLLAAAQQRNLILSLDTELNTDQPETYHITVINAASAVPGSLSVRISGGDLRGLMYGLMDAADQLRTVGTIQGRAVIPGFAVRAVRIAPSDSELTAQGFYLSDRWIHFFQMLAHNRINRATLVLPAERLETDRLRYLSNLAFEYGVDFFVGLRPAPANIAPNPNLRAQLRR
jgi:hypothetical protein